MTALQWDPNSLIFIDETGFHKHIHRKRGRSLRGERAFVSQVNSKGFQLNACVAVCPHFGLLHYEAIYESWNEVRFSNFIKELMKHPLLNQVQGATYRIILDNVAFHKTQTIRDIIANYDRLSFEMVCLPPYSPHLNAIEYVFSRWKSRIRKIDQSAVNLSLSQQLEQEKVCITDAYVNNCMNHVTRYLLFCQRREPLEDFDPTSYEY
jgi:transposase